MKDFIYISSKMLATNFYTDLLKDLKEYLIEGIKSISSQNMIRTATVRSFIIGAFIQITGLLSVGGQYVRFFSPTQMLGDTLTIIIFLTVVSIFFFLIHEISRFIYKGALDFIGNKLGINFIKHFKVSTEKYIKFILTWCMFLFSFLVGIILVVLCIYINKRLLLPSNMMNTTNICKQNTSDVCRIQYFNDKYIFVERERNQMGERQIEIMEFSKFFTKSDSK